ncbi:L-sorbose 1-dehydrogenase [Favolaschia claudopus]|uniref:L-sorbose 1-dehydrogenase n=1 Tax=Favolaschia claudopus TaxID=2862362 RepID=A0AAW0CSX1_9AGAR
MAPSSFHHTLFTASILLLSSCLSAAEKITYVVVGGGTAGLAVATRLSENADNTVIVLEAGSDGFDNTNIKNLTGPSIQALPGSSVDYNYHSEPLKFAANQVANMTRGKVLGGSSAVNGALFTHPSKSDLDAWESDFGAAGWNWTTLSAAIDSAEHFSTTARLASTESFHGSNGPIFVTQRTPTGDVWTKGVIPAVVATGGKESTDQSGGDPTGIWYSPKAMFPNSTRSYSANSYYLPNAGRSNLQVHVNSTVSRIVWGQSQNGGAAVATGVEYFDADGKNTTVNGDRVILSGGAFGTPQILELSGIGNPDILKPLGISTVVNLPAVGENLSEQPTSRYIAALAPNISNAGVQLTLNFESPRNLLNSTEWDKAHELIQTAPPGLSDTAHKALIKLFESDAPIIEFMGFPNPANLVFLPILLHPMSRGSSHIVSTDVKQAPKFDLALFQSPFDLYILTKATARARRFATQDSVKPFVAAEIAPGANVTSDEQFETFVKNSVGLSYHPLGTAALGSVVNKDLRVNGTANVFVVDGSIIPMQPAAHPSALIYGIGEHAATLLKAAPLSDDQNQHVRRFFEIHV